jgi:hypothetical protein
MTTFAPECPDDAFAESNFQPATKPALEPRRIVNFTPDGKALWTRFYDVWNDEILGYEGGTPFAALLAHRLFRRYTQQAQQYPISITKVAKTLHCSGQTISRALRQLVSQGFITSEQRRGTYPVVHWVRKEPTTKFSTEGVL